MIVVTDLASAERIQNPSIRLLVQQRINDLGGADFVSADTGYLLVIEEDDSLERIQNQLGFSIIANRLSAVRYDQPGFTPSWEFIEELADCWDGVWILGDSWGVEVFIPKDTAIDPDLQAMCAMYAVKAQN